MLALQCHPELEQPMVENRLKMAAFLKSKMVVSGNDIVTLCIIQFSRNYVYVDLSSLYLKVAKKA